MMRRRDFILSGAASAAAVGDYIDEDGVLRKG